MFGPSLLKKRMPLGSACYVPALRWRRGESGALSRLTESIKDRIVPFITIPPVEFDFETRTPKRTVHEHVDPFVERFVEKWGWRPAWITLDESIARDRMDDSGHVFDHVLDGLRTCGGLAIPALPLGADSETKAAVARAVRWDRHGVGVIVRLEELMRQDVRARVLGLVEEVGGSPDETDVLIDMGGPAYEPYEAFAKGLVVALGNLTPADPFRNLVLIGTAYPESLAAIETGSDEIPRHDWLFYRVLLQELPADMRRPTYGDHTIVYPSFKAVDMRALNPAGKVVYTKSNAWGTRKGGAFRDDSAQMHGHCSAIVSDPSFEFRGASFSYGDKYIAGCATGVERPSNQTRWKEVGINHHITRVADDLANLGVVSSTI